MPLSEPSRTVTAACAASSLNGAELFIDAVKDGCAQVMKAVSGKFHPIFQWFYFDAVEALPEGLPLSPAEVAPQVQPSAVVLTENTAVSAANDRLCWLWTICNFNAGITM